VPVCAADTFLTWRSNGSALTPATNTTLLALGVNGSSASNVTQNGTWTFTMALPNRRPPAFWYSLLPSQHRDTLLAPYGGTIKTTGSVVYATAGKLVQQPGVVYAVSAGANATAVGSRGQTLTAVNVALSATGVLQSVNGSSLPNGTAAVATGQLVALSNVIVNDTTWWEPDAAVIAQPAPSMEDLSMLRQRNATSSSVGLGRSIRADATS
jgi:hypothetical protein